MKLADLWYTSPERPPGTKRLRIIGSVITYVILGMQCFMRIIAAI
jgi:hypothetical protein